MYNAPQEERDEGPELHAMVGNNWVFINITRMLLCSLIHQKQL